MPTQLQVASTDGRNLDVVLSGPEDGRPLIFHTGTPAAGVQHPEAVKAAEARGLRHISYSRPGYAGSDRHAGRTVADCVDDVRAVADHVGIDRFFTVGLSGGGPHALACAALLGERVIAAATIGAVAPHDADGLDFLRGMGEDNQAEFDAATTGPDALFRFLQTVTPSFANATAADIAQAFGDLVTEVDRDVVTGDFAEYLADSSREGLANGIWGWFDDDLAFVREWGFEPSAITCPLTIWHGVQDQFVPASHGEWLASHVAVADLQLRPDHGHLSLWTWGFGDVLDGLAAPSA